MLHVLDACSVINIMRPYMLVPIFVGIMTPAVFATWLVALLVGGGRPGGALLFDLCQRCGKLGDHLFVGGGEGCIGYCEDVDGGGVLLHHVFLCGCCHRKHIKGLVHLLRHALFIFFCSVASFDPLDWTAPFAWYSLLMPTHFVSSRSSMAVRYHAFPFFQV